MFNTTCGNLKKEGLRYIKFSLSLFFFKYKFLVFILIYLKIIKFSINVNNKLLIFIFFNYIEKGHIRFFASNQYVSYTILVLILNLYQNQLAVSILMI